MRIGRTRSSAHTPSPRAAERDGAGCRPRRTKNALLRLDASRTPLEVLTTGAGIAILFLEVVIFNNFEKQR